MQQSRTVQLCSKCLCGQGFTLIFSFVESCSNSHLCWSWYDRVWNKSVYLFSYFSPLTVLKWIFRCQSCCIFIVITSSPSRGHEPRTVCPNRYIAASLLALLKHHFKTDLFLLCFYWHCLLHFNYHLFLEIAHFFSCKVPLKWLSIYDTVKFTAYITLLELQCRCNPSYSFILDSAFLGFMFMSVAFSHVI